MSTTQKHEKPAHRQKLEDLYQQTQDSLNFLDNYKKADKWVETTFWDLMERHATEKKAHAFLPAEIPDPAAAEQYHGFTDDEKFFINRKIEEQYQVSLRVNVGIFTVSDISSETSA